MSNVIDLAAVKAARAAQLHPDLDVILPLFAKASPNCQRLIRHCSQRAIALEAVGKARDAEPYLGTLLAGAESNDPWGLEQFLTGFLREYRK